VRIEVESDGLESTFAAVLAVLVVLAVGFAAGFLAGAFLEFPVTVCEND
jgi:hypothetical protein